MSRDRSGQVWRAWLTLYGTTLAGQAITSVRWWVVAALLGPQQFGLWKSLQLALSYTVWTDLGALRGLGCQMPLFRGEGRVAEAEVVQSSAWTLLLIPTTLVSLGLVATGAWISDSSVGHGVMLISPVLLTTRVLYYFLELANAQKNFALKSRGIIGLAVVDAVLAPLASWWGGLWLFMWSVTATNALVIAYLTVKLSFSWHVSWRPADLLSVSAVGFPIAIAGFAFETLRTVDRLVIVTSIGTDAVGYYGLAMMVFDIAVMVPMLFGQVMLPHVAERFGREQDKAGLFYEAEQVIVTVNRFLPFLLAVGCLLLPAVTGALLPAYMPGIKAARILVWAALFVTVHSMISVVLITLRHRASLVALNVTALVVGGLVCIGAVKAGLGIDGVAAAMCATYGLAAVAEFLLTGWICGGRIPRLSRDLVAIFVPGGAAVAFEYLLAMQPVLVKASAAVVTLGMVGALAGRSLYAMQLGSADSASGPMKVKQDKSVSPR